MQRPRTSRPGLFAVCGQRIVPGMQGGWVYGAVAYDPTFGARTQSPVLLVVAACPRRDAALLPAAEA